MALSTKGFRTDRLLQIHFYKHKEEYAVSTEAEYLALADAFLGGLKPGWVRECTCSLDDDIVRYDKRSQDFGISNDSYIVTFYKLNKGSRQRNEAYFEERCNECGGIIDN